LRLSQAQALPNLAKGIRGHVTNGYITGREVSRKGIRAMKILNRPFKKRSSFSPAYINRFMLIEDLAERPLVF
jgi:hypothetical protein